MEQVFFKCIGVACLLQLLTQTCCCDFTVSLSCGAQSDIINSVDLIANFATNKTVGICNTNIPPTFTLDGSLDITNGDDPITDIYGYVAELAEQNDVDEYCHEFDATVYSVAYRHDCKKYTGDSSQTTDTLTVRDPDTGEDVTVTIELECTNTNSYYCSYRIAPCGGNLEITDNLLDENKGACDGMINPAAGSVGVYDTDEDSWITQDLHSYIENSNDECVDFSSNSNINVYYIHDCDSSLTEDTFELGECCL